MLEAARSMMNTVRGDDRDKTSITIKSTPIKDLNTTLKYTIKSGKLMKRNEQGAWQPRHMCLVPHTFLYYFDEVDNNVPRGIIDLEYYTHMKIEENDMLTLIPPEDTNLRPFYLKSNDNDIADWMSAFKRDRYLLVRDERDAYQELQDQFSSQINASTIHTETLESDNERLGLDIAEARKKEEDSKIVIQKLLTLIDNSNSSSGGNSSIGKSSKNNNNFSNDLSRWSSLIEAGEAIENHFKKIKSDYDTLKNIKETEKVTKIYDLEYQVSEMEQTNQRLERLLLSEKSSKESITEQSKERDDAAESRYRDAMLQVGKLYIYIYIYMCDDCDTHTVIILLHYYYYSYRNNGRFSRSD